MVLLYSLICTNYQVRESKYSGQETEIKGYIHSYKIDGNHLQIELRGQEKVLVNYYFKTEKDKNAFALELGAVILVKGTFKSPPVNRVFNLFNYQQYLKRQQIYYLFTATDYVKLKANHKLRYKLKAAIIKRSMQAKKTNNYLQAFLLGNKDYLNYEVMTSYQTNGISHLLAISGLHVSFVATVLFFLLKQIKIKEITRYLIVFLVLFVYLFLTDFTGSVLRATIFFILLAINRLLYLEIKIINVLLVTLCVILIIKPTLIYDLSFQFSFIISYYLILSNYLINKVSTYGGKLFMVSIIAFVASIPLCSSSFFQVNLLSPVYNLFFVPYVSFIIFPLAFLTFIFPLLDSFYLGLIKIMEMLSLWCGYFKSSILILAKPTLVLIISFYVILTITIIRLKQKCYGGLVLLLVLFFYHSNYNYWVKMPYLVFIDVGQGDSTLINLPNGKGTILIDTGGLSSYYQEEWARGRNSYSLGRDTIVPYLKSLGLKQLDYLIITHGHFDHMGEVKNIVTNFKVKNVVFNGVALTDIEESLVKFLKQQKHKIIRVKAGSKIKLGGYIFNILNPNYDLNPNDNSIVIYTVLNQHKILITGDISKTIETKIITTYKIPELDILQIGHHGSLTSTSVAFLEALKPKYGVIPVGVNNKFDHPHPTIIKRLQKAQVQTYLTSKHGSIRFDCKKKGVTIKTVLAYDNLEH